MITVVAAILALVTFAQATGSPVRIGTAYELPGDRVYPEGIAADPGTGEIYSGSFVDGTIFKMAPGHRAAQVFLPAGTDGRHKALGLAVDAARRLWVIDADTGVTVYDTDSRRLLARFDVPGQGRPVWSTTWRSRRTATSTSPTACARWSTGSHPRIWPRPAHRVAARLSPPPSI